MGDPVEKLDPIEDDEMNTDLVEFNENVKALYVKATRLGKLARPLRKECSETAELAGQAEEAVGDI